MTARVVLLRLCVALSCLPLATTASAKPVEREYDVQHLLVEIPNFDDHVSLIEESDRTNARRPPSEPEGASAERLSRELERWVTSAVARPGSDAAPRVDPQTKRLRVSLEEADHKRLAGLLERDRVRRQTTVTLEARVLGGVDQGPAPDDLREKLALAMMPGSAGVTLQGDEEVKQFLRVVQTARDSTVVTAPRMTLFNGQRAYVLTSTQHAYVKGYSRPAGDPAGEWTAETGVANGGVLLDARPAVGADGHVALAIRLECVTLNGFKTAKFAGGPPGAKLEVQVPEQDVKELNTVTNLRDGGSRLFYLGTASADAKPGGHYFLVLRAAVNPPVTPK
jgi:hypothetical protein